MKKIRVLHILDVLKYGSGVSSVVLNYYQNIDKNKIIFDFMIHEQPEEKIMESIIKEGSHIFVMPSIQFKNIFEYEKKLDNFFSIHTEYRIIHGHLPHLAVFYLEKAKKYQIPVRIIHSHSTQSGEYVWKKVRNKLLANFGKRYATNYVACGQKAAEYLFGKKKISSTYIMINAVNIEKYQLMIDVRNRIRENLNWKDAYIIGHIGRFCRQKNQGFIIKIFEEIVKIDNAARLLLVGGGEKKNIDKELEKNGLRHYVHFTGIIDNTDEYLQSMDVFILPSRFEGVPVACIEALAAGLPCVVSENVSREIEHLGAMKYLSLKDSAEEWAKQILALKEMVNLRRNNKLIGYDITVESEKLTEYYLNLL